MYPFAFKINASESDHYEDSVSIYVRRNPDGAGTVYLISVEQARALVRELIVTLQGLQSE